MIYYSNMHFGDLEFNTDRDFNIIVLVVEALSSRSSRRPEITEEDAFASTHDQNVPAKKGK